jgi:hypothetical protein
MEGWRGVSPVVVCLRVVVVWGGVHRVVLDVDGGGLQSDCVMVARRVCCVCGNVGRD